MITCRLKTTSKEEMIQALESVLLTSEEGWLITSTHNYWVYIIGTLYAHMGVMVINEDGFEYEETSPILGYHANLRTNDTSIINALQYITVNVDNPLVKVAGE